MKVKGVLSNCVLAVLASLLGLLIATASSVPGFVPISGAADGASFTPPDIEKPNPKCIDLSGIDAVLEELRMLLEDSRVRRVTRGLTRVERYQSLAFKLEWLDGQELGYDKNLIEPARKLSSTTVGAPDLELRKVLVNRDYTRAYFDDPQVFTFTNDGRLIYADNTSYMVGILDPDGELLASFGGRGEMAGEFKRPSAIVSDRNGRIYISDASRGNVQLFSSSGDFLGELATGLSEPISMALFEDLHLFVLEKGEARVRVYNINTLEEVRSFGGEGSRAGRFLRPSSLCLTKLGSIVIADSGNDRIQILDRRGKVEKVWNGVRFPQYVASDSHNNVFVLGDTIRKYGSNGSLLAEWSRAIEFDDGSRYFLGNGLYPELQNLLLINDRFYGNILVYEVGS